MVDEFTRSLALDALERSKKVERDQNSHEDLCAERYRNIQSEIAGLRAIFKWAGGALFALVMSAFGFLINNITTTNTALSERNRAADIAATRIELLQDALARERRANGTTPAPVPPSTQQP